MRTRCEWRTLRRARGRARKMRGETEKKEARTARYSSKLIVGKMWEGTDETQLKYFRRERGKQPGTGKIGEKKTGWKTTRQMLENNAKSTFFPLPFENMMWGCVP
jgi:hypothetical protein